jgi:raffinose/stachyose/melibiose transport system substrate-binding protein
MKRRSAYDKMMCTANSNFNSNSLSEHIQKISEEIMKNKMFYKTLSILCLVGLMAACGPKATPTAAPATAAPATAAPATAAPATAAPATAPVTLTYMISQGWGWSVKADGSDDARLELAKKFTQQTGIKVDVQVIPSDQYYTVLQTKLNSGEGPDIFGGQSGKTDLVTNYNVEKNALDLSDQPWTKTEDPAVLDQASVNGKVYGLTVWNTIGTTWVMNYNKDIFSQLNLSVPTTFADLKAACLAIKATGITPIFESIADGWHQVLWFGEMGVQIENLAPGTADLLNTNKTTFAENPTALLLLQQFKDLYDSGCFGDNSLSDTGTDTTKMISSGQAAMSLQNLTFSQQVKSEYPDFNQDSLGVFIVPMADNQVLNLNPGGPTMFIWTGSKHIKEVKQLFNFITQPENLQYLIDNDVNTPTLPFTGVTSKLLPYQQALLDAHQQTEQRGVVYQTAVKYVNPQWMDIGKDMVAMVTGAETPQQVLANIDQRRAQGAEAAKDPNWP